MIKLYKRRSDGEILFSEEAVEDPDLVYLGEIEERGFGGRAIRRTDTGDTEEETESTS